MLFATTILKILFLDTEESSHILRKHLEKKITMRLQDCELQDEELEGQNKAFFKRVSENIKALFAFAEYHYVCHSHKLCHAPTFSTNSIWKEGTRFERERMHRSR